MSTICCQFTITARTAHHYGTTKSLQCTKFVGTKLVLVCPIAVVSVRGIILVKLGQRPVNGRTEMLPCREGLQLLLKPLEARKSLLVRGEGWNDAGITLPWELWELHAGAEAGPAGSDKRVRKALAGGLSSPFHPSAESSLSFSQTAIRIIITQPHIAAAGCRPSVLVPLRFK